MNMGGYVWTFDNFMTESFLDLSFYFCQSRYSEDSMLNRILQAAVQIYSANYFS